jgi:hypothetical protein
MDPTLSNFPCNPRRASARFNAPHREPSADLTLQGRTCVFDQCVESAIHPIDKPNNSSYLCHHKCVVFSHL